MSLQERMRWTRKELNLPVSKIIKDLDIPQTTYYYYEMETKNNMLPPLKTLYRITRYFDVFWQHNFVLDFPKYASKEVKKITIEFIAFGEVSHDTDFEIVSENYKNRERELLKLLAKTRVTNE